MLRYAYTPFIWPFVASLLISAALGIYALRHRHTPVARTFAWLMLGLSFWTFCYLMELSSATLAGKTFWLIAKYPGAAGVPVIWFVLSAQLTRSGQWLQKPLIRGALWGFVIVICLAVFTNDLHHWYWTAIRLLPGEPESVTDHGFVFWIYAAGAYLLILSSVILFFRYYRETSRLYRQQALLMALGGFIPLGGRILEDFLNVDLFPHVDNVLLLLLFSCILFAVSIFRYGALTIVHIAHNLVIQNIEAGIIVVDTAGQVIQLNPYAARLAEVNPAEIIGHTLKQSLPAWPDFNSAEQEAVIVRGGEHSVFQVQVSPIKESATSVVGHVIVLFDITARKLAEVQLEHLAHTDPLTGVANRRYFFNILTAERIRAQRYGHPISLLMLDIDHFKHINDSYGHQIGDEVLKFVASTCQHQLRASDILARYGGEEFICALIESDMEGAQITAERIRCAIEAARPHHNGRSIQLTISIGVACMAPGHSVSLEQLVMRADEMLYEAKQSGRNQVRIWLEHDEVGR